MHKRGIILSVNDMELSIHPYKDAKRFTAFDQNVEKSDKVSLLVNGKIFCCFMK